MTATFPLVFFRKNCAEAVPWAIHKLEMAGFQAVRTFDLQAARLAHLDCACPHHGTAQCTCQMIVLLVYKGDAPPGTLVVHGSDETSSFFLVSTPQQSIGPNLEKSIQDALNLEIDVAA
jgi:hypothetical protein